ncbi:MAG: AEC family transporter [Candidatus Thorarchaeota archaeon]|nr:AEC family transporter [Candidatus Thorarchaeota archaeon]
MTLQSLLETTLQFGQFYGFIVIGYLVAKLSGKGKEVNRHLNSLLVNILVPVLFIYTLLTASLTTMSEIPLIIVIAIFVHILGPILMYIRLWGRNLDESTKGVFYICVTFNNALFIPLPLVLMFLGASWIPVVIIFSLTQMTLLATLGSFMGAIFGGKDSSYQKVVKDALTFPPFIAAIIGVFLLIINIHIPFEIASLLSYTGPLTTYLSLIAVGLAIGVRFSLVEVRSVLEVIGIRQILVPFIVFPIILLSRLSQIPAAIIMLEAMMPPAVLTVVYATSFNLDAEKAATIVTVGTLFLLPFIPIIPLLLA